MTKRTDAWMPLYIADYLADTGRLTTEGHGAYLLLLMDYWRNGAPPDDDETLAAITKLPLPRWRQVRRAVAPFFTIEDGYWRQKRADAEMLLAGKITTDRRAAALQSWERRRSKTDANAPANPAAKPMQPQEQTASKPHDLHQAPSPLPAAVASDAAREAEQRIAIGDRVLEAAGIDSARWKGNYSLISAWLSAMYDPELDILPAVRAVAARPGYQPPGSLNYFTKAIEQHWQNRCLDIPKAMQRPTASAKPPAGSPEWRYDRALDRWSRGDMSKPPPTLADFQPRVMGEQPEAPL